MRCAVVLAVGAVGTGPSWAGSPLRSRAAMPRAADRAAAGHPVSGAEVLRLTQEYVAAAPKRYVGSAGHAAAEKFIRDHFQPEAARGDFVTDDFFARTPIGMVEMRNFVVKYPGKKDGIIVLASHYETNYPLKDVNYVGADDGGCTTALLIAIGQYLRVHPPEGYSVWLLFDDGEEAIGNDGMQGTDQLYGVRHIAAKWAQDGTLAKIKAFIVADMLGWKSMNIDRETNSTPWLLDLLAQAGKDTGHSNYLFKHTEPIDDDHLPFKERGVPALDVIAYEYGPYDSQRGDYAYHHTPADTLDKLSAQSLQVAADIFMDLIRLINQHPNSG
ncbi:MAG TPA: M28 family peptidase [Candidatus Aquilonibacter sp.]|nr:M28 family peptidase [Candidatus Aquilonibacter sp.]